LGRLLSSPIDAPTRGLTIPHSTETRRVVEFRSSLSEQRIFRDAGPVVHFIAMMQQSTPAKLPRDIATKILDRAANLDATDERIDLAMLRSAAADAGISPDAFERALMESISTAPQPARVPERHEPSRLNFYEIAIKATIAGAIGGTLVIGVLSPFADATAGDLVFAAVAGTSVLAGVITYLKGKLKG
jgi:hypothetical protein